jgi:hypothetical protein
LIRVDPVVLEVRVVDMEPDHLLISIV